MRLFRLLLPAFALCSFGFGERPPAVSIRFFAEANAHDSSTFSTPIKLGKPPRDAFLEKVPAITERQIRAVYPFQAADGTWGCAFKLDRDGAMNLEAVSTERRGTFLCPFLGTRSGNHRLVEILIDRTVTDGIISVPRGLTDLEISVLRKQFKVLGGNNGPKPNVKYRMWNPFRKKEAAPPGEAPPE